jgi:hypothetical protein
MFGKCISAEIKPMSKIAIRSLDEHTKPAYTAPRFDY